MLRFSSRHGIRYLLTCLLPLAMSLFLAPTAQAQLYQPEGLHMPGGWNGYTNFPDASTHFAFRGTNTGNCGTGTNVCTAGGINKVNSAVGGQNIYQTTIHAAASGGDVLGGSYPWLYTSGNPQFGQQFNNKWAGVTVVMNTLQSYSFNSGSDNNVTFVNGNYYTSNWVDNGYGATQAIFMVTSAAPVGITTVVPSPNAAIVVPSTAVDVNVTLSGAKSAQENVLVRYSTNNFTTSTVLTATLVSGNTYKATIPGQADGSTVQYYAFTSTLAAGSITSDYDAYSLRYKNNSGAAYTYSISSTAPVNITFTVDLQNESGITGVSLAGTFNGYSTSATPLTNVSGTIWSVTIPLVQNAAIQYKFVKNGGAFEDNISAPCGNGSNRTYSVGTTDATIATTCFSKCGACPPLHPVTFTVDAQNEAGVTAMHLSGEFNGYNTTATPMTNVSGTLWSVTIPLEEGRGYSYKFVANSGNYEDNIPAGTCNPGGAGGGNRNYTVTTAASQSVASTCFSSCGACAALSTVTLSVDMRDQNVTNGVVLSGNFNGYNTTATPMNRLGTTSVYTVTIVRPEGYAMSYKFVNGSGTNNYEPNPGVACGPNNRAYTVPTGNTTIATVCFGLCTACPPKYNQTFRVNMAYQAVTGAVILKDFTTGAVDYPMTLESGTTYKVNVALTAGAHIFKFFNTGGPNGGYENNIGAPCGNGSNRTITVTGSAIVPTFCYNSCIDCGAPNVFTGATNTDFNTGSNWNSGLVPNSCTDNIQVNGTGPQPAIAAASNYSVGNVALQSGAILSMGAGASLSVCGDLSGTGGQTSGGAVVMNGTGAQAMTGSSTIDNLTINKPLGQ